LWTKIILVVTILFIYINMSFLHDGKEVNRLTEIVDVTKKHNIIMDSWQATFKSPLGDAKNYVDLIHTVNETKEELSFITKWGKVKKGHHFSLQGESMGVIDPDLTINKVEINAFYNKGIYNIFVSFEIGSEQWDKELYTRAREQINSYFKIDKTFYTVKGHINEKVDLTYSTQKIMNEFEAKHVGDLTEKNFISVSANNPNWSSEIKSVSNESINLQIAHRYNASSNKTHITLGTPIIATDF